MPIGTRGDYGFETKMIRASIVRSIASAQLMLGTSEFATVHIFALLSLYRAAATNISSPLLRFFHSSALWIRTLHTTTAKHKASIKTADVRIDGDMILVVSMGQGVD